MFCVSCVDEHLYAFIPCFSIFLGASWEGTQRGDVEWLEWLDGDCFGREMRE